MATTVIEKLRALIIQAEDLEEVSPNTDIITTDIDLGEEVFSTRFYDEVVELSGVIALLKNMLKDQELRLKDATKSPV